MGIQGLLQIIKQFCKHTNIKEFNGKIAAVDAMFWLYKGLYSMSAGEGESKNYSYLKFPLKMIHLLQKHMIKPILIFDGAVVPLKYNIESQRSKQREALTEKANNLRKEGKIAEANEISSKILNVNSEIIGVLLDVLRFLKVDFIVAPYEADAQIAYMVKKKYCDFAITEDSDLIAYRTKDIVYKLDTDGNCINLRMDKFKDNEYCKLIADPNLLRIKKLKSSQFIGLCALSGCDYVDNVPNFGIKKALKMFDYVDTYVEVINKLQLKKKFTDKVPSDYKIKIQNAIIQFKYAWVYDPKEKQIIHKKQPKEEIKEVEKTIGAKINSDIIKLHCEGYYDIRKNAPRKCNTDQEIEKILKDIGHFRSNYSVSVPKTSCTPTKPSDICKPNTDVKPHGMLITEIKEEKTVIKKAINFTEEPINHNKMFSDYDEISEIIDKVERKDRMSVEKNTIKLKGEKVQLEQLNPFVHKAIPSLRKQPPIEETSCKKKLLI